jgi:cytochrome c oxidase subunit 2
MNSLVALLGGALLLAACRSHDDRGGATAASAERVVRVTAKKFEYSPSEIHVKKGEPVVLEFVSLDRTHGFEAPDLGLRTEIHAGEPSRLRFAPDKVGRFPFHCDVFCGSGHEDMTGEIVVEP